MMNEEEKPLTVTAAARLAGMTIEGIRKAIRRGKLKAVVVATRPVYGVRHEDLASYLESVEKESRGRPRSAPGGDG